MAKYPEQLKLENQICFPLYVASKEIIRKYQPILEKNNLTYTQYIVLMDLFYVNYIEDVTMTKTNII